ncbi:MAG: TonB-dependent receptor, partial [Sphingomonadales bacterium]|nr:TonB-dependent receptor [Sphingomonadales bacterium]
SDVGFFAENDWTVGPLVLTAGARADHWSISDGFFTQRNPAGVVTISNLYPERSDWQGSFRGGGVLSLGGGFKLRAAGYTGFRLPTLNELYRPFTVFPVTTQANAALTPEKLRGYEAGFDWSPIAPVTFSFTAFDNRVKQAIANVTIATNTRKRFNVDAIHARGLEFALRAATGPVFFDGSLALTDAKVEASGTALSLNGMRPAQTPKVAGSATLGVHPAVGWTVAATLRHVGAQYEDDLQTDVLPAATTIGAFVEVPLIKGVSLVLRGENLTDVDVVTRNQGGSIDLGTPRTLWAGLRFHQGR